ncbi:hypothetical protein [Leifsonia sp. ZF2019]|nr:hypothetical protein [Leifsonia sp. ZF2019]
MSDLFEAISDIVGLPVRKPLLPFHDDTAAADADGDWTPEDAA